MSAPADAASLHPWCVRMQGRRDTWAYLLTSTGARATNAAAVFGTREEALGLWEAVKAHIAYTAPECLPLEFAVRLAKAEVVPLPDGVRPWPS